MVNYPWNKHPRRVVLRGSHIDVTSFTDPSLLLNNTMQWALLQIRRHCSCIGRHHCPVPTSGNSLLWRRQWRNSEAALPRPTLPLLFSFLFSLFAEWELGVLLILARRGLQSVGRHLSHCRSLLSERSAVRFSSCALRPARVNVDGCRFWIG